MVGFGGRVLERLELRFLKNDVTGELALAVGCRPNGELPRCRRVS